MDGTLSFAVRGRTLDELRREADAAIVAFYGAAAIGVEGNHWPCSMRVHDNGSGWYEADVTHEIVQP